MDTFPGPTGGMDAQRARIRPFHEASAARGAVKNPRLAALMRRAQDNDRIAYISLLRELVRLLQRLVRRRLGFLQPSDREDLVQDILLSLHAARATYEPRRPFTPWLMTIAHHRMVDRARRHTRVWENEVPFSGFAESILEDVSAQPDRGYGDPQQLRQAVNSLPAAQRTAIELLKLRELSLREAAGVSGMSIGALKAAAHRAITTLRASLDGHL